MERTRLVSPHGLVIGLGFGLILGEVPGCKEGDICTTCEDDVFTCFAGEQAVEKVCMPFLSSAPAVMFQCQQEAGFLVTVTSATHTPCASQNDTGEDGDDGEAGEAGDGLDETGAGLCSSWDPGASVTLVSSPRTYEVDAALVEDLIADSRPLYVCDTARWEPQGGGGFMLTGATSDTLMYKLGLRNGDVPVEVNGHFPIETQWDAAYAFGQYMDGETEFELTFERNNVEITFDYELVP